jgi:hypothetical protein
VANALQAAIGLATAVRRSTQTTADDAALLEGAIGRAIVALRRIQPPTDRRKRGRR